MIYNLDALAVSPDSDRSIIAGRDYLSSVQGADGENESCMSLELLQLLSIDRPQLD